MTKSRITKAGISAVISAIMVALPLSAAFADASFYFTDDFSTAYHIDANQTTAVQTQNGSVYLTVGALNGTVTSGIINTVNGTISDATIDAQMTLPAGTFVLFYLSNDNGVNWYQANRDWKFMFPNPGTQLRWRALMSRSLLDFNPYIDSVTIKYTVTGDASNTSNQYAWQNTGSFGSFSLGNGLMDPQGLVCSALSFIGFSCNAPIARDTPIKTSPLSFNWFGSSSSSTDAKTPALNADLTGAIATAGTKDLAGNDINLVRVSGSQTIYELVNGLKHPFPTMTIFASYGYTTDMVQTISQAQLDKYPRAKLVKVYGTKQVYYLTEGNLVRPIPNDTVFNSYGDRKEDIIAINQKEFNFYPQNQYVFLETPLNRDVFQLTNGGKRYLTPMALIRMEIPDDQVAPINQTELDTYKTLAPIVN